MLVGTALIVKMDRERREALIRFEPGMLGPRMLMKRRLALKARRTSLGRVSAFISALRYTPNPLLRTLYLGLGAVLHIPPHLRRWIVIGDVSLDLTAQA